MDRRTLLLAAGAALLAGCAGGRAREAVSGPTPVPRGTGVPAAPPAAPPAPSAPSSPPAPEPTGPLVSAGRAQQGPVEVRGGPGWVGLDAAYAYVNRTRNDCAQAAVATLLTTTGTWERPDRGGPDRQEQLVRSAPPDVLGGVWGSSPRLVRRMLGAGRTVSGLDGVRTALQQGEPVLVLLDLRPLGRGTGAHWTVVIGLDATHVQVTNLGGGLVRRDAFERAWSGLVPAVSGVARTGLVRA